MTKYERINRAKLTEKGKVFYDKIVKATDGFKNKEAIKKNKAVLDKFYDRVKSGLPEAIKPVKSKKSKAKPKAKAKKPAYKNVNMGNFAKETSALAKKEGISYKEAQKKMSAIYKERKAKAQKKQSSDFDKMIAGLKKKVEYRGGRGLGDVKERGKMRKVDLKKDAKLDALDFGKRTSKGTGANQYGKAKKGRTYYEYRNNRADVKNAPPSQPYPKLESGGKISEAGDVDFPEKLLGYAKGGVTKKDFRYYINFDDSEEWSPNNYSLEWYDESAPYSVTKGFYDDAYLRSKSFKSSKDAEKFYNQNPELAYQKGYILGEPDFAKGGDVDSRYSYDIEYVDSDGDEYSEGFDSLEDAKKEIKYLKENGYRITRKFRYLDDKYVGSFAKGGEVKDVDRFGITIVQDITYENQYGYDETYENTTYETRFKTEKEANDRADEIEKEDEKRVYDIYEYKIPSKVVEAWNKLRLEDEDFCEGLDDFFEENYDNYAKGGEVKSKLSKLKKGDKFYFPLNKDDEEIGRTNPFDAIYVFNGKIKSTYHYTSDGSKFSTSTNRDVVSFAKGGELRAQTITIKFKDNSDALSGKQLLEDYYIDFGEIDNYGDELDLVATNPSFQYLEYIRAALKGTQEKIEISSYAKGGHLDNARERIIDYFINNDDDEELISRMGYLEEGRERGEKIIEDRDKNYDDIYQRVSDGYDDDDIEYYFEMYLDDGSGSGNFAKGGMTKEIENDFNMPKFLKDQIIDKNGKRKIDDKSIEMLTDYTNNVMPQTKDVYFKDGKYTKERQKLHKQIINEFKGDLVCIQQDEPIAILMGGSPASGKSTFLRKYAPYLLDDEILRIDADETRSRLPEYDGWNASATHLETKDIVNTLLSDRTIGLPCEYDIIYDGTMNNTKAYLPLIKLLKKLGYKIYVVYVDNVPKSVIEKRVKERYQKSGRFVPLEVVDDFFSKGKTALNEIKKKVDGYMVIDGSDSNYRIIEEGGMKLPKSRKYSQIGTAIDKMATGGEVFSEQIARGYDVNLKSGTGTYAKGGITIEGNPYKNEDFFIYRNGKEVVSWSADELMEDDYSQDTAQEMFDLYNNDKKELSYRLENLNYAKGGKTKKMKKDDNWIQGVDKEMERKGTKGAFTKQAKRAGMSTVAFAKEVLRSPDKYSEKTRERAQFMKNVNPELFEYGGKISEAGDVDFPEKLLGYAKGGKLNNIDDVDDLTAEIMLDIEYDVKLKPSDFDKIKDIVESNLIKFYNKGGELFDADTQVDYAKGGKLSNNDMVIIQNTYTEIWPRLRDNLEKNMKRVGITSDSKEWENKGKYYKQIGKLISSRSFAEGGSVDSFSHEIARGFDVNLKSGTGTYAVGGRLTEDSLNQAKGIKVKKLEYMKDQEGSYYISLYLDDDSSYIFYSNGRVMGRYIPKDYLDGGSERLLSALSVDYAKGGKTQGYNARLDESLAMRDGSKLTKKVNYKGRRDESKGEEKALGKRAYSSVDTMDDAMLDLENFYAKGGETKGRYEVRVEGVPLYAAYDDLDEAYDDFINTRSSYTYESDVMIIDTKYDDTIEYYDAQEDREQSDDFAKGGYVKNQILSFSFNANNTSLDEIIEIVEKYSKNWRTSGGTMDDVGVHVTLKPSQVDDLESDLKSVDVFNLRRMESRYAKGGKIREMYVDFYGEEPKKNMSVNEMRIALIEDYESEVGQLEASIDAESDENFRNEYRNEIKEINKILKKLNSSTYAKGGKMQGYNSRLDESLAMRRGKAKTKKQSKKDRRDESKAMEKAKGKRAYSSVKTMDKKVKYRGKK